MYEEDVKSVTKLVKACINKLMMEWDRKEEQKQVDTAPSQENDASAAHASSLSQDTQKKVPPMSLQETPIPNENGNTAEPQVLHSYYFHYSGTFCQGVEINSCNLSFTFCSFFRHALKSTLYLFDSFQCNVVLLYSFLQD